MRVYSKKKQVVLRKADSSEILRFESRTAAAKFLGVRVADITNTVTGRQGSVRGYLATPF